MGFMKRLYGWHHSRWLPVYGPFGVISGMREERDPEAFLERKRAAKEAAKERAAIQAEPKFHHGPSVAKRSNVATEQGELFS
jgi:hypothetical protein